MLSRTLSDSGADFSAISLKCVKAHGLTIHPPSPGEPQVINGAAEGMETARLGHVFERVTLHYPIPNGSTAVSFTKKFEVMEMDLDFLFGREVNRVLFPHDEQSKFGGAHASITDVPSQVVRVSEAARLRAVTVENAVDAGDEYDMHGAQRPSLRQAQAAVD